MEIAQQLQRPHTIGPHPTPPPATGGGNRSEIADDSFPPSLAGGGNRSQSERGDGLFSFPPPVAGGGVGWGRTELRRHKGQR
jgi:hypothetical protein